MGRSRAFWSVLAGIAVAIAVGCSNGPYGGNLPIPPAPTPIPIPSPVPTAEDAGIPDGGLTPGDAGLPGPDAGQGSPDAGPTEAVITIENFTFSPANLEIDPGTTVRVRNLDAMDHSVTSMSSADAFTPGPVNGVSFDTGAFQGERSFTVPSGAPHGTVVPYFCTVHLNGMRNSGQITVR